MKNVLFLGLGSIGQRHFRNLKKIDKKLNFFCIRQKKNSPQLNDKNKVIIKKFSANKNGIKEITWADIGKHEIDTAFVTNPTSLHVETSLKLARLKINLFIEKPISHDLKDIDKLKNILKKNKLNCEIGFQARYDDLLIKLKKIIKIKKYGDIIKCNINHCHFLPNHHKYENYKISYASNKNLGGGVLLCFSHEIDYAEYLFGKPKKIIPIKISSEKFLNIDVESSAQFSILYKKKIPVIFNLDFIKKNPYRSCEIQFDYAYIKWDLLKNTLVIESKVDKKYRGKIKHRNDLFLKSLRYIKYCFSRNKNAKNTFINSLSNLKTILSIKKSFAKKKIINL